MTTGIPTIALSVRQPWAWAIIHGGKDVENRSAASIRHMNFAGRKRIAVHAAKGMTQAEYEDAAAFMNGLGVAWTTILRRRGRLPRKGKPSSR